MTSDELIDLLIEKVAGGGNLLLNIGPTADGRIPVIQQQRLTDIGNWLSINGESIYESRKWIGSADNKQENIYFTCKGNDLYILCTEFPEKDVLVKGIKKAGEITMLGYEGKVKSKKSGNNLMISVPDISPGNLKGIHAWVFKITNFE
jgi:alpha-L-fucosidase